MLKQAMRALGACAMTVLTGLAIYDTPPDTWAQFWSWIWQPAIQGLMVGLSAFGINLATRTPRPAQSMKP